MRCTYCDGCNPQQEEKHTIQNTLHDRNDVQSFWRDEEWSVNKLSCRLTQLCLDVSRGARSSQRCNEGSAWMYSWRQAVAVMLYILQSYCSFTPIKCAERESWEQNGPMMRGRVVSSTWEDAAAFIVLQRRVRYQMMPYDSNDEIVNKTTRHDRLSEWVKDTTPQLLYDYRCALLSSHHRNSLLNSSFS